MTREEQLELVEAVRRGEDGAFERLQKLVEPLLRRYLFTMVPASDMDDVIQDAMLRIFRKIDQFQGEAQFTTWCVTVGKNTALMYRRKQRRDLAVMPVSIDETVESRNGVKHSLVELGYEDRSAEQNLAYDTIHAGLVEVSVVQRVAIGMQLDGYSIEEIASALQKSVPATKSILMRGKEALAGVILSSPWAAFA